MDRLNESEKYLKYWQNKLKFSDWKLSVELTDFNRKDYEQSGDIRVDLKNKKAVVLISRKDTSKDLNEVVLHELVHLLLWDLDHRLESLASNKMDHLGVLEDTVEKLTKIIKAHSSKN